MTHLVAKVSKYIRIYRLFFKNSVMLLAAHRFNLLMSAMANVIWTLGQLFALQFLFEKIDTFDGWTFNELVLLLAFGQIYVYSAFVIFDGNFKQLPKKIIHGQLDRLLTRPINIKFFISFEEVSIAQIIPMFVTIIPLMLYATSNIGDVNPYLFIQAFLLTLLGTFVFFLISFAIAGLNFIWDNTQSLKEVIVNGGSDMNRVPLNILPSGIQMFFTFIIPIAFVSYYPVLVIKEEVSIFEPLILITPLAILLYYLGKLTWAIGLRRYSGVG